MLRIFHPTAFLIALRMFLCALGLSLALLRQGEAQIPNTIPAEVLPPKIPREFRGAWVATVGNIDWPSKPALPPDTQRAELIDILDKAKGIGLNAIVLQVRPMSDTFYKSGYEPWSEYLVGRTAEAPVPFYDPLEFAIQQAHARGIELHAWFNPFRAGLIAHRPSSPRHVTKAHPKWVRDYGTFLWLDPGEPAVQEHVLRIIMDVVHRYDIDGVHLDDYFYPYKEKNAHGQAIDFPDFGSWGRYRSRGGKLPREDWRRENINHFVQRLYSAIKGEKKWVKFGISPFGIWQPGFPAPIRGLNSFQQLYADSRQWLNKGWVDYLAPQLYWGIQPKEQSYPLLWAWWREQNLQRRFIWPGDAATKVGDPWDEQEIVDQIAITRKGESPGHLHWNMSALRHKTNLVEKLRKEAYRQPAVIPAMDWFGSKHPLEPAFKIEAGPKDLVTLNWNSPENITIWGVQVKRAGRWETYILPAGSRNLKVKGPVEAAALTAFDRFKVGSPTVLLTP